MGILRIKMATHRKLRPMSKQVFISYSRQDGKRHAERLENELKTAGYRVWRDTRDINPNQDFTAEIEMGIEKSDLIAVCVTPDIRRENSFVRREIQYADIVRKPTFPCRVMDVPPPISIINKEWLEFHKDWRTAFERLRQLVTDPRLQKRSEAFTATAADPFRDYLQKLYQQIVRYLDQTVIKLVDLDAKSSPEAVPQKQHDDILLEFFESSVFAQDIHAEELPKYTTFKDAFDYHKGRLLLLGEPGAGKTITLMAQARDAVAARLEDPQYPLPILKIIATWQSNPPMPLTEWVSGKMPSLKSVINDGNALLLLDGLDELGGERTVNANIIDSPTYDPRQRFIEAVGAIHTDNQVLVTCRVQDYAAIGRQIPLEGAITLQPLTDAQLREYLSEHPAIYNAIQEDAQLREMAQTPLLLSLITFAWDKLDAELKSKGDLQAGDIRDTIFEAYCHQRYEHEARKRNADLPFTYQEMMNILGELAMWNMNTRRPGKLLADADYRPETNVLIPYDFLYVLGSEERATAFKAMTIQLNILAPINEVDYRFVHLLLQDFMAYTFSLPRMNDLSFWRKMSSIAFASPINALANLADKRAIPHLMKTLENSESYVRITAIWALGKLDDTSVVEALMPYLQDDDPKVRSSIASALGKLGDLRAVEPLMQLINEKNWKMFYAQQEAIIALGKLKDIRATELLINCLEDSQLQHQAAQALGEIGDERAIDPLMKYLNDPRPRMRQAVIIALGHIGSAETTEYLITCLDDKDENIRRNAASALGEIGDSRAIEPLIQCLNDIHWIVRSHAVEALSKIGPPAVQPLIHHLRNVAWDGRAHAAEALGEIGQSALNPLIKCLEDDDIWVRRYAVQQLGKIGNPLATESLISCFADEDTYVKRYTIDALVKIGEPSIEPLLNCLTHQHLEVRILAAETLGRMHTASLLAVLQRSQDVSIRELAQKSDNVNWSQVFKDFIFAKYMPFIERMFELAAENQKTTVAVIKSAFTHATPVQIIEAAAREGILKIIDEEIMSGSIKE